MTIAIFINNISNSGGTEVVSKEYALRSIKEGNTVHFVTADFDGIPIELSNTEIKIFPLREKKTSDILTDVQIQKAIDYCNENNIERSIFVLNVPHRYSLVSNSKLIQEISKISTTEVVFHNSPKSYLKRYWNNEYHFAGNILRKIRTVIQIAPRAKRFIKKLGKSNVKIFTLSHGCQQEMEKYYKVNSAIRYNPYVFLDRDLPRKKNIVTYCGRLASEKNVFMLLKAWKLSNTNGWILRLIGDGVQREFLEEFCRKNKLQNVEFIGNVPHSKIYDLMAESKIFCLTSFNEGFPTVMVEAMNMGNAIITTKFDGISDELLNSDNSIITGYDTKTYSSALNRLLADETLVGKMGVVARNKCREFYSSMEYLEKVE